MAPAAPPPREQVELLGAIHRLLLAAVIEHYLHGVEGDGDLTDSRWLPVKRGPGGKPLDDGKKKSKQDKQKRKKPSRKEAKKIAAVQAASDAARARMDTSDGNTGTDELIERHLHTTLSLRVYQVIATDNSLDEMLTESAFVWLHGQHSKKIASSAEEALAEAATAGEIEPEPEPELELELEPEPEPESELEPHTQPESDSESGPDPQPEPEPEETPGVFEMYAFEWPMEFGIDLDAKAHWWSKTERQKQAKAKSIADKKAADRREKRRRELAKQHR